MHLFIHLLSNPYCTVTIYPVIVHSFVTQFILLLWHIYLQETEKPFRTRQTFVVAVNEKKQITERNEWTNEWMNEYFIYQHRCSAVKTVKSRTVSTGQNGSKSTYNCPNTTANKLNFIIDKLISSVTWKTAKQNSQKGDIVTRSHGALQLNCLRRYCCDSTARSVFSVNWVDQSSDNISRVNCGLPRQR